MNVLIVGGAGYIGGAVVDLLKESEHDIHVYDSLMYEESYRRDVPFTRGDCRDYSKLTPLLEWSDVVVWLAAIVGDGACAVDEKTAREVNVDSVKELVKQYDKRIIFMSTCSVYGAQNDVLTEESPTKPLSIYAETKVECEALLKDSDALIFRLGTLYGVSDRYSRLRLDLVVNTLVGRAHSMGKLTVFGGDQWRPLLHVRDVAIEICKHLDTDTRGIYNLSKQNCRILDLAHQIRNHFEEVELECTDMKFEDLRNYRVCADKARRDLGHDPKYTLDDGILQVKEIVENGRVDVDNPRYSNHGFILSQVEQSK